MYVDETRGRCIHCCHRHTIIRKQEKCNYHGRSHTGASNPGVRSSAKHFSGTDVLINSTLLPALSLFVAFVKKLLKNIDSERTINSTNQGLIYVQYVCMHTHKSKRPARVRMMVN